MISNANLGSGFRRDINSLRALAVAAVVLFHFGVPGFSGGFVGVDVFFVISGFLMTGIVVKGLEQGSFSPMGFYMARARRIVPALVFLCAVLLSVGWFVLLPPDYKTLSTHSVYSLTFLSNIEFWLEAGYFDMASHEKWLLHTWSLSVEWQFYLILPVALGLVWKLKPGRQGQVVIVICALVASLAASASTTEAYPSASFFLLHTRAWEMLCGGLVFLQVPTQKLSITHRRWLEAIGLLLIVLSISIFSKDSVWPGWRASVPVLGVMLVLVANHPSPWTGNEVAQWIGDRSYSLYLWHWPIYVALVYVDLQDQYWAIVGGIVVTLLLGHLSYLCIENPARRTLKTRRIAVASALLAATAFAVAIPAVAVWGQLGVAGRFPQSVELAAKEGANKKPRRDYCFTKSGTVSPSCMYGGDHLRAILIGDSHADAVTTALAAAVSDPRDGVMDWTYVSCLTAFGVKNLSPSFKAGENCDGFLQWAVKKLEGLPRTVPLVIVNRTSVYALGHNEAWENDANKPLIYFSQPFTTTSPAFLAEFSQRVTSTACLLAKNRTVYLVRPIPEMGVDVPKAMSRPAAFGFSKTVSIPLADYHKRHAVVWAAQDAAHKLCGVKILDPLPYLCREGHCYGSKQGRPLYYDDDHLSEFGNKLLVPMFAEVFRSN